MNNHTYSSTIDTFNGALLLKKSLFVSMRDSPQVVRQGFLVVLLVGLLVGGIEGARGMLAVLKPDHEFARWSSQVEQSLTRMAFNARTPEERLFISALRENILAGTGIARAVMMLPTPLPPPFRAIAQGAGKLVSYPLSYLQDVLLSVVFTHIVATWLGGRGSLQQMLGLGALATAPHALDGLAFLPVLGPLLGIIAWWWGLMILIVATSFAHRLDAERATLAVLFFPMVGMLLAGSLSCVILNLLSSQIMR